MYATVLVPVCLPFFRSRSRLAQWWVVQLAMLAFGIMLAICGSFVSADAKIGLAYLSFITPVTSMFAVELMPYEERPGMAAIGIYTHAFWIIFALVLAMRQLRRESLADQPQRPPC